MEWCRQVITHYCVATYVYNSAHEKVFSVSLEILAKLTVPIKRTVQKYHCHGWSASQITQQIETEYKVSVSRQAISRFIFYCQTTRSLVRKPGSGRSTKKKKARLRTSWFLIRSWHEPVPRIHTETSSTIEMLPEAA